MSQKMSLQQVLAPQLQQSLALLQAPTLELKALVEQELQQNPILEEVPVEEAEQKEKNQSENETESAESAESAATKKAAEYVTKVKIISSAKAACPEIRVYAGMAKLIIFCFFIAI